jgi:hypothetical protein
MSSLAICGINSPFDELSPIRERERQLAEADHRLQVESSAVEAVSVPQERTVSENAVSQPQPQPQLEQQPQPQPWSLTDTGSIFTLSRTVGAEPQTASILIQKPASSDFNSTLGFDGELLRTGSISIPISTSTGQIAISTSEINLMQDARSADVARALDSSNSFVAGIRPVSAAGVIKSRSKDKPFPKSSHRGRAHMYLVLTSVLLMAAVAGLLLAALMLGLFN